jgi:hypothetical protein
MSRKQVELLLEGEVVPEHIGHRLGCAQDFRFLAERDELRNRQARRAARVIRDDDADAVGLLRLRRRLRRRRILGGKGERGAHGEESGQEFHGSHQRL